MTVCKICHQYCNIFKEGMCAVCYDESKRICKICKQSWKPPRSIIYKNGMCLICYHVMNRNKDDKAQKNLNEYL